VSTSAPILVTVNDPEAKSQICNKILRELPEWFGIESAIIDYVEDVKNMSFCVATLRREVVGFVALEDHNPFTSEIHVMGILREHHRQGIGRQLVSWCEHCCRKGGQEYLTVKTLDESRINQEYANTRQFYLGVGFRPLEVFPDLWGPDNPCLMMAKHACQFTAQSQ